VVTSEVIVTQARTWLGTPFHHQARVKGKGCDCLGLIIGVVQELGLKDKQGRLLASYDEVTYSRRPSGAYLIAKLSSTLDEVPIDNAQPGHLALFTMSGNPQHLGILTNYDDTGALGLIHCNVRSGGVVEHRLDEFWRARVIKVFTWAYQEL
jgi:NlpC/P60 family putative phage cell wall peptidase